LRHSRVRALSLLGLDAAGGRCARHVRPSRRPRGPAARLTSLDRGSRAGPRRAKQKSRPLGKPPRDMTAAKRLLPLALATLAVVGAFATSASGRAQTVQFISGNSRVV